MTSFTGFPKPIAINTPDHFGFGVAARVMPKLLLAGDIVRVNYSASLAKDFTIVVSFAEPNLNPSMFTIDDATEVHFGGEYNIVTGNNPVFVRAGVFTNPNHTVHFAATPAGHRNQLDCSTRYNLLPRDTEVNGTVGSGVAIGPRFQVDVAYVFKKEFVASTAVRF